MLWRGESEGQSAQKKSMVSSDEAPLGFMRRLLT